MFLFSRYVITKESDYLLEFIEKKSVGFFLGLFFVIFGSIIVPSSIDKYSKMFKLLMLTTLGTLQCPLFP